MFLEFGSVDWQEITVLFIHFLLGCLWTKHAKDIQLREGCPGLHP